MPLNRFSRSHARRQPGFQGSSPIAVLGGLNEDENRQALRPADLRVALNCARKGGMTGTRPGVTYGDSDYTVAIAGTNPAITGIFDYRRNRDDDRDLLVVQDGDVFKDSSGTALDKSTNSVTISTGNDYHWTFASYQDKVFAAGGKDGDSFWYWDGAGALNKVSLVDSGGSAVDVKYVFAKWNMIFVGGMNGANFDDNEMVFRYCDYATDATVATNWKSANVLPGQLLGENFGVSSYGSEYNTGIASFQDNRNDSLLFLTNERIVSFVPNPNLTSNANAFRLQDTVATGCVNQNAFVNLGLDVGDAVYLSQDGIHSLAQSEQFGDRVTQYLSWPIRKTFDTLNRSRFKYASGAFWPTEGMVLFSVATGSNTTNNLILCMDIKGADRITPETVRWYRWDLTGITANVIRAVRGSDKKPYLYVGGTAGQLVRFDRDTYSDLGTGAISTVIQTKDEDFGLPSREKHIGDTYCILQGSGNYTINHSTMTDDGEIQLQTSAIEVPNTGSVYDTGVYGTATYGDSESVIRHRIPGVGSSVTIGHRFAHAVANEPFWLGVMNQEVMISGPTDDATPNMAGG